MFDMKNLTPLNARPSQILHEMKDKEILERPDKMRSAPTYNAILGQTTLNQLRAVVSTYHMKMKFLTKNGVREVKGDQVVAREYYMVSCRNKDNETLMIENLRDEAKVERSKPAEDLKDIELYPGNQEKTVRIGIGLADDLKLKLVDLLRSYSDIFSWTASNMPRIDPEVKDFTWIEECHKSFEELKRYLSSPSLLTKRVTGEDSFLYLSISEVVVSTVLLWEEEGKQRPVYYVSKVLQDMETRYPRIDKVALALVISARKLRPYFQSHTIVVLTDQPLEKVLQNPDASRRLVNWSVELGEFDIKYRPRAAIKAQALSDFVVKCTVPEDPPQLVLSEVSDSWLLYVDGSSKVGSSEAELILISPEKFMIEYALCFDFQASNNEAEYEALLAGISDSQLVVNHILGEYGAKDDRMAQYLQEVKTKAAKFKNFAIHHILRDQNAQADSLSKLTSADISEFSRAIYIEFLRERSIQLSKKIDVAEYEPCWMDPIIQFLISGTLPSERIEARNLCAKAARFALVDGVMYKKSFSLPYLKFLSPKEADYALREVHEGIIGQHLGRRNLAHKILRQGYYWLRMQKDAISFKRRRDTISGVFRDRGTDAVEMGLPTIRVLQFSEAENEASLRGNLDLLDDVRAQA
ncbi:hypothetical protein RJ639_018697 [Escallonia herrerae]|uniref:Reverse transcriptase/retrotransposon-derived protein RNase H-like domain-containing protein n=1 Tax=Escallonia herrerae TaxID=1293975 RepID=A0AA88V8A0_9ASTE|nr:hypothetical protein RJ639_018697 [Escallonia herrerae]